MSAPTRDPKGAKQRGRRRFLQGLVFAAGALGAAMLGFVPIVKGWIRRAVDEAR